MFVEAIVDVVDDGGEVPGKSNNGVCLVFQLLVVVKRFYFNTVLKECIVMFGCCISQH